MWLFLSLLSVFMFTGVDLLLRVLAVKTEHPRSTSFVFNSWGALFAILLLLAELPTLTFPTSLSANHLAIILLTTLGYGLYERSHFSARKHIDASTMAILMRLAPLIALLGSLFFFNERISPRQAMGAVFLISSAAIIVHKNPHFQLGRPLLIALFSAFTLGIAFMLDKPGSQGFSASLYSFIMWTVPLVVIAFPSLSIAKLQREAKIGGWKIALVAFLNVSGYFIYLKALAIQSAAKVIPIVSTSDTLTVIAGIVFLKETTFMTRKLIVGALMFIGILLLR